MLIHTILTMIFINLLSYCKKVFHPHEHINDWEICNETPLPEKEDFYSHLNIANITDVDYTNSKRVCKDFQIKNLGRYHDFYVQSNTLLLVDMF